MKIIKSRFASMLKHKLTLQKEVQTADGVGGYARTWQDMLIVWGSIISTGGKENVRGKQLQAEITHRIVLRYTDKIDAGMRLIYDGRAFNIRTINNISEENRTLELLVVEGNM